MIALPLLCGGYSCIRSGLKIWGLIYRSVATIV
nr:MAG TPA: hypothetical protein [Caudoviricetes sp.]